MMKTSSPIKQHLFFYLIIVAIVSSSCASFQYASYENDRGYDHYGSETVNYDVASYQDYFAYKSQQYAEPSNYSEGGDVFTDVDAYSSSSVNVDAVNVVSDYGYDYNSSSNYSGWGGNVTNVYINTVPNYNMGWGNWGVNSWAWNNWGWNSWYGGAYNFGRYNPWSYGYASPWRSGWGSSWGWNSMFYGPVWSGANYGFYCPNTYYAPAAQVYYPSSNNASPVYVTNNTRRGNYSNLTRDNNNIYGVTRSSRRGYRNGYFDYEVPGKSSSAVKNYSTRRGNYTRSSGNTTVRRNNNTYSTRRNSNNSSYNNRTRSNTNTRSTTTTRRSSNTRSSSNNTYRSSSPSRSRSSGSSFRSSSPSRSSGGTRSSRSGGRGGRM